LKNSKEKMAKTKQKGFVLILVIIAIALIGVVMFVLTEDANTIIFQSDTAYLEAVERNLVASGLAWAKQNIKNENKEIFNKSVKLDITEMNIRNAALNIVTGTAEDDKIELELNTLCSRGRRTFRHHDKYTIRIKMKL
jgi:type II secretory pathway component PulK